MNVRRAIAISSSEEILPLHIPSSCCMVTFPITIKAHFQTPSAWQQQSWMGQSYGDLLHKERYWISRGRFRLSHSMSITLKERAGRSNTTQKIQSHGGERVLQPCVFCEGSSLLKQREAAEVFLHPASLPDTRLFPQMKFRVKIFLKAWAIISVVTHHQAL